MSVCVVAWTTPVGAELFARCHQLPAWLQQCCIGVVRATGLHQCCVGVVGAIPVDVLRGRMSGD